jgi:predicted component of type VI protein secretion system
MAHDGHDGSIRLPRPAPLLAVAVGDQEAIAVPDGFQGIVGRDPAAGLVIDDPRIDGRHAELVAVKDCLWLRALPSSDVRWNGEPADGWVSLLAGDVVDLGPVRLTVRIVPDAAAGPDQATVVALFVFVIGLAVLLLGSAVG